MSQPGYASTGFASLVAPHKGPFNGSSQGCCGGCDDAEAHGLKTPCQEAAERKALVAGVTSDLETAKWFIDNRWYLMGGAFAVGGLFFATVSYFVNRNRIRQT
jgi:hypothetical protein